MPIKSEFSYGIRVSYASAILRKTIRNIYRIFQSHFERKEFPMNKEIINSTGKNNKAKVSARKIANKIAQIVMNTAEHPIAKRILARNCYADNNTFISQINNNDAIVGASGGGKTRSYLIPNILHSDENMIICDTKGNIYNLYGDYLRSKGYTVDCIDFTDLNHSSCGYNPLDYIRENDIPELVNRGDTHNEGDVKKLAAAICPNQNDKDPYWDMAAAMYLEMLILYVLKTYPKNKRNLSEVYNMLCSMGTKEFIAIMAEEAATYPKSAIAKKFRIISQNEKAERMHASIIGILAQHLDVISYSSTERFFSMEKRVDFSEFVNRKHIVVLNVSDSDRTNDMLVNCFYTQAFQYLMDAASKRPDSRLPIPVRFMLDDFSTNTVIPDFPNLIAVIRSREISVSIIIQSLSQLESLYDHSQAVTILNNCDRCLYLGGNDVETAEYFAKKLNFQPSTVLNLPLNSAFLFERGKPPMKVAKYNIEADEIYASLQKKSPAQSGAAHKRTVADDSRSF